MFARFGCNGLSTREIAASAELNEVTIYRHFPRKRDLYLAVLRRELRLVYLRGDLMCNWPRHVCDEKLSTLWGAIIQASGGRTTGILGIEAFWIYSGGCSPDREHT